MRRISLITLATFVLLLGLYCFASAAGLDFIQYSGGVWNTTNINGNDYVALCRDRTNTLTYYGARAGGGLDLIQYSGGTWTTTSLNSNQYVSLCCDGTTGKKIYAGRVGGIDQIAYSTSWATTNIISSTTDIYYWLTEDRTHTQYFYAAMGIGGLKRIYYSSGWRTASVSSAAYKSYNQVATDGVNGYAYYANYGVYGGFDTVAGSTFTYTNINSNQYGAMCPDTTTGYCMYASTCKGRLDKIAKSGSWATTTLIASGAYYTGMVNDATATQTFYGIAPGGLDYITYSSGWTKTQINTNQYYMLARDATATKTLVAAQTPGWKTSVLNFTNLSGISQITIKSRCFGMQAAGNRDYTWYGTPANSPAYDYSASYVVDTSVAEKYRLYTGARWVSNKPSGDGDHIIQQRSVSGLRDSFYMPNPSAPELWNGIELGYPSVWWYANALSPLVFKVSGTYYLFWNCQINSGDHIDYPAGATATAANGRVGLATSTDGSTWTRKTDRGVILNIPNPAATGLTWPEACYNAADANGTPWYLYVWYTVNGTITNYHFMKSNDPTTFDWNTGVDIGSTPLGNFGNYTGIAAEAPGGPLFVRISLSPDPNDPTFANRWSPSLEFSRDGQTFTIGDGPAHMAGITDMVYNKNLWCFGMSQIDGIKLEYQGNNTWHAFWAASSSNDSWTYVFYSELASGEFTFTVTP